MGSLFKLFWGIRNVDDTQFLCIGTAVSTTVFSRVKCARDSGEASHSQAAMVDDITERTNIAIHVDRQLVRQTIFESLIGAIFLLRL